MHETSCAGADLPNSRIKEIKSIIAEAPAIREKDREYQLSVYRRWAETMTQKQIESGDVTSAEGDDAAQNKIEM